MSLSLKNWGGGKNTHSVLELSPSRPMWISSPNQAKWECVTRLIPAVSALQSEKGKAPPLTYSSWNISNAVSLVELYMRGVCPCMHPDSRSLPRKCATLRMAMPVLHHFASNVSVATDIRNRKRTEAMLSP